MNKLLAVLLASVALGASADDSYLYWMVESNYTWKETQPTDKIAYARVGVLDNSTGKNAGYLTIFAQAGDATGHKGVSDFAGNSLYASLGDYAKEGYSFYIELFNDSSKSLGRSENVLDYSKAMADYVYNLGISTPPSTPWQVGSFTTQSIPEPSSALLMLLGCAGLALKRKKQANA